MLEQVKPAKHANAKKGLEHRSRAFTRFGALGLLGGVVLCAGHALAHHSLVAQFDVNSDVQLHGEVTRLDWQNPHIWLYLEVRREDGALESWGCELGSPRELDRAGWSAQDLPVGSQVVVRANVARDGSQLCSSRNIQLDDGTPIFTRFGKRLR